MATQTPTIGGIGARAMDGRSDAETALTIRRASVSDAATVGGFVRALAACEGHADDVRFGDEQLRRALAGDPPRSQVLLAERGGQVQGMVSHTIDFAIRAGGDVLRVDEVFVLESARRMGVGTGLFDAVARICADSGMTARWEIEPGNASAQAFYRGLGVDIRPKLVARWSAQAIGGGPRSPRLRNRGRHSGRAAARPAHGRPGSDGSWDAT